MPKKGYKQTEEHRLKNSGENHPMWKGKEYQDIYGRWHIWSNCHRVLRSRYIAEKCFKRKLLKKELIHHINKDKSDDRPENLYVFATRGELIRFHHLKIKSKLISNIV